MAQLKGTPENEGSGQVRSGPRPRPGVWRQVQVQGGASPDMVLWLSKLKLCKEMGYPPERLLPMFRLGTLPGSMQPTSCGVCLSLDVEVGWNVEVGLGYTAGFGFAAGCGYAAGLGFTWGFKFAAGVENAPGESGYPC